SLLKRALGYEYDEVTTTTYSNGEEETKRVTKHVVPDTTAQIFWLKNRKPDDWRDKKDVNLSGDIGIAETLKKARERVKNGKE
ncbi:MAG: helix-turn-helix domain-containing protein, partial [Culicoidibacterales bacterium]